MSDLNVTEKVARAASVRCSIPGCAKVAARRGWCHMHYNRWHRHGDPLATRQPERGMPTLDRFWRKVEKTSTCWLWQGSVPAHGYGIFSAGGRNSGVLAHRFAYEVLVGPIPDGLELDHLCRVKSCVNPEHLEPVTHAENTRRHYAERVSRGQETTACPRGHEFTPANTYRRPDGARACRRCNALRKRKSPA